MSAGWWPLLLPETVGSPADALDDYEPTDAELGANLPSDPYDSPSYSTLTKGPTQ